MKELAFWMIVCAVGLFLPIAIVPIALSVEMLPHAFVAWICFAASLRGWIKQSQ